MSCRPLPACRILPVFLALLVLWMVPVSGMTIHLPDQDAVPTLVTGISHSSTYPEFRYDLVSCSWSGVQPGGRTEIEVVRDGSIRVSAPAGSFRMQYGGISRNGELSFAQAGTIRADRNRLSIDRGTVTEWYISGSNGIEQGMTIAARPEGSGPFAVTYRMSGDLRPHLAGQTLVFFDTTGPVLQYSGLSATDAAGRALPARLGLSGTTLSWQVDDRDAIYPVTIDPLISGSATLINATQPRNPAYFGCAVARYDDTILVGAYAEKVGTTDDSGQAYFFTRSGGTWTQVASFNKSEATTDVNFGKSVAIWNDTALVGVPQAYVNGVPNTGQVYVFTRASAEEMLAFFRNRFGAKTPEQERVVDEYVRPLIQKQGDKVVISGDSTFAHVRWRKTHTSR